MANAVITENTFNETNTANNQVNAFIEATESSNEDEWTVAMIVGWDTQAVALNKMVADIVETVEWYEIDDSDVLDMVDSMQSCLTAYDEFRAYVKECKGW